MIVAQGLNVLTGYTGQPSLGHAGFYAIGALYWGPARRQLGRLLDRLPNLDSAGRRRRS